MLFTTKALVHRIDGEKKDSERMKRDGERLDAEREKRERESDRVESHGRRGKIQETG